MSKTGPHRRGPPVHEHLVTADEVVVSVELVIADPGQVVVGAEVVVVGPGDLLIGPGVILVT